MKKSILAKILAYKGRIICWPMQTRNVGGFVATGGKMPHWNIGCTILDSRRLEVSEQAMKLMDKVRIGTDAIGDLDWFACHTASANPKKAFGWFGGLFRVIDPAKCVTARDFQIYRDDCVIIPNEIPKEVAVEINKAFKNAEMKKSAIWRLPYAWEPKTRGRRSK